MVKYLSANSRWAKEAPALRHRPGHDPLGLTLVAGHGTRLHLIQAGAEVGVRLKIFSYLLSPTKCSEAQNFKHKFKFSLSLQKQPFEIAFKR